MTYLESAKDKIISHKRAMQELRAHGLFEIVELQSSNLNGFYADLGRKEEYLATDVLNWLGY